MKGAIFLIQFGTVFLWFLIYSLIGWIYESILCSITQKKIVNRGFLAGPLCPVYGFGALIIIVLLGGQAGGSILMLFLSSAVLTCVLEYITSYLLEKLFHAKWWDYSHYRFNLNGRISLLGAVVFGVLSVLLLKVVHPFVSDMVSMLPGIAVTILAWVLFALLLFDTVTTVTSILKMNHKLEEIQEAINKEKAKSIQKLEELRTTVLERFEASEFLSERIKGLLGQKKFHERRLLKAFPRMHSIKHYDALEKLKEALQSLKNRTGIK